MSRLLNEEPTERVNEFLNLLVVHLWAFVPTWRRAGTCRMQQVEELVWTGESRRQEQNTSILCFSDTDAESLRTARAFADKLVWVIERPGSVVDECLDLGTHS